MLKSTLIAALGLTLGTTLTAAHAQTLYAPSNFIPGSSVKDVPLAEWEVAQTGPAEQTGARILIAAGEEALSKAPPNAVRYTSRTYAFPSGQIRVLTFTKANGGVLHQITGETTLVVLKGSAEVGVVGRPTRIKAGDVVSYPSGVLRSVKGRAEDTTVVLYTVGSTAASPKAQLVRAADTPEKPLSAKKEPGAPTIAVQRFVLDGNSVRHARVKGPGRTPPANPRSDVLIYIANGSGKLTVGDETKEVTAGDAVREEGAKPTYWDVAKEVTFIATDAPAAAPPAAK